MVHVFSWAQQEWDNWVAHNESINLDNIHDMIDREGFVGFCAKHFASPFGWLGISIEFRYKGRPLGVSHNRLIGLYKVSDPKDHTNYVFLDEMGRVHGWGEWEDNILDLIDQIALVELEGDFSDSRLLSTGLVSGDQSLEIRWAFPLAGHIQGAMQERLAQLLLHQSASVKWS